MFFFAMSRGVAIGSYERRMPAALTAAVAALVGGQVGASGGTHYPPVLSAQVQRAAPFTYAPGTRRYRLTTVVVRSQNQAGGRAPFEFTTTTTMDVTVTLAARARDTLALTLTVDSVAVTSDLDAP